MDKYFICDYQAKGAGGQTLQMYSMMTFASTMEMLLSIVKNIAGKYIVENEASYVNFKIWQWEDGQSKFIIDGYVYDGNPEEFSF